MEDIQLQFQIVDSRMKSEQRRSKGSNSEELRARLSMAGTILS